MSNIRDVAKLADVSTATVSHVLNETRFVSEPVKQRVLQAMDELSYHPNAIAQGLRKQRTKIIGLLIPDIGNSYFTELAQGIDSVLSKNHYSLLISNSDENEELEAERLRVFENRLIDGLIYTPVGAQHGQIESFIKQHPVVFADRRFDSCSIDAVVLDNEESTYNVIKCMLEQGHTRIGLLLGPNWISATQDRIAGWKKAYEAMKIPWDEQYLCYTNYRSDHIKEYVTDFVINKKATALFIVNSNMTISTVIALRELGVSIPEDVVIVGCTDSDWAKISNPSITMVQQPSFEIGKLAAQIILKRIEEKEQQKEKEPAKIHKLKVQVKNRESFNVNL